MLPLAPLFGGGALNLLSCPLLAESSPYSTPRRLRGAAGRLHGRPVGGRALPRPPAPAPALETLGPVPHVFPTQTPPAL